MTDRQQLGKKGLVRSYNYFKFQPIIIICTSSKNVVQVRRFMRINVLFLVTILMKSGQARLDSWSSHGCSLGCQVPIHCLKFWENEWLTTIMSIYISPRSFSNSSTSHGMISRLSLPLPSISILGCFNFCKTTCNFLKQFVKDGHWIFGQKHGHSRLWRQLSVCERSFR